MKKANIMKGSVEEKNSGYSISILTSLDMLIVIIIVIISLTILGIYH